MAWQPPLTWGSAYAQPLGLRFSSRNGPGVRSKDFLSRKERGHSRPGESQLPQSQRRSPGQVTAGPTVQQLRSRTEPGHLDQTSPVPGP